MEKNNDELALGCGLACPVLGHVCHSGNGSEYCAAGCPEIKRLEGLGYLFDDSQKEFLGK